MSDTMIQVHGLSKQYRLGRLQGYQTLRESLMGFGRRLFSRTKPVSDEASADLWALKDVSFSVNRGEVVGVIGRNGAGKSTLLKVLSRITGPTEGSIEINGRVGSLLEVGTGFHPELTGRENIFLNGAILGMHRSEILKKFDEIVEFSEIERFIDTPVKRYSSGMYMRLAFAVAAHLEPEILVVDEVLAVGDASFQKKCLGKMGEVAKGGRTILFVSHNMVAIRKLCNKAVVLNRGRVQFTGDVGSAVDLYLTGNDATVSHGNVIDLSGIHQAGSGQVKFLSVRCRRLDSDSTQITVMDPFEIEITFQTTQSVRDLVVGLAIRTQEDLPLFATHWNDFGLVYSLGEGRWTSTVRVDPNYLRAGRYNISIGAITAAGLLAHVDNAVTLEVQPVLTRADAHYDERIGVLFIPMKWSAPTPLGGSV
jgi:lipopolysaccharide transport system ATP-binding protein